MFNNISFIIWKKTDKYYCLANNCGIKNGSKLSSYVKNRIYEKSYLTILENYQDQIIHDKVRNNIIVLKYVPNDIIIELNTYISTNVQLLSSLSHKIRNPLTDIIGILASIDRSNLTGTQKECLHILKKSSYEIVGTLNDVIDIVNFFRGELKLNLEKVNLSKLLYGCRDIVEHNIKSKGISLKIIINNDVPKNIIADTTKLKQIIINLLTNSIQHINIGGIIIKVSLFNDSEYPSPFKYVVPEKKYNLLFSIKDTGSGMEICKKNLVDSILGINNTNDVIDIYGYGGLGLIISKFMCNLMGGNIWFNTLRYIGTTFYFNIHCDAVNKK